MRTGELDEAELERQLDNRGFLARLLGRVMRRDSKPYAILVLPILFAAGMSLFDTADGLVMSQAYGWAFLTPIRKVSYNLTVTVLSVAVALIILAVRTHRGEVDRPATQQRDHPGRRMKTGRPHRHHPPDRRVLVDRSRRVTSHVDIHRAPGTDLEHRRSPHVGNSRPLHMHCAGRSGGTR